MTMRNKILRRWMYLFSRIDYSGGPWQGYDKERLATTDKDKQEARLCIAQDRYEESQKQRLEDVFQTDLTNLLHGKDVLEIGSNHGGASLYYYQNYQPKSYTGIDTTEEQAKTSILFFKQNGINSNFEFRRAFAEDLPFQSNEFDAIICFDVIEHVRDVEQTLSECYRVLRPHGIALIAFPSYYHPNAHHLNSVTTAPFIHWIYSPDTLMEVYFDIMDEHPEYRDRKGQSRRELRSWEKLNHINGTTMKSFKRHATKQPWTRRCHIPLPLGSYGKIRDKIPGVRILSALFYLGTKLPVLSECCNHRIVYILEK